MIWNKSKRPLTLVIAVLSVPVGAAAFEGSLGFRTILVQRDQLANLKTDKSSSQPEKAFAIPTEELLSITGPSGAKVSSMRVYISGTKVRADVPGSDGGYFVIDTDKNTTLLVMSKDKKCIEWTAKDTEAFAETMARMKKEVERIAKEKLPNLPPDQRAQVEKMLKSEGLGGESPIDVQPLNEKRTINKMQTEGYAIRLGEEKTLAWVTQDQPELTSLHRTVQEQMEKMVPPSGRARQRASTALAKHGLPVLVQTLGPDQYIVQELVAVESAPVAADFFTVPADYKCIGAMEAMKQQQQQQPQQEQPQQQQENSDK